MTQDVGNMRIDVLADGPYKVSGGVPLSRVEIVVDENGDSVGYKETYRYPEAKTQATYVLCRCGRSADKPFCDGSHVGEFHDETNASEVAEYADGAETIMGGGMELFDSSAFCIGARFCDRAGGVWGLTEASGRPGANPAFKETAISEATLCPSGRLVMVNLETGKPMEPDLAPSIALIEDPSNKTSAAIWVRGGIPVYGPDGEPFELRNRVTLCRCGASRNKVFCDASHYSVNFDDGHAAGE